VRHYADRPLVWRRLKDELRLEVSSKQFDLYDDPLLLYLIFLKWGYYPLGGASEDLDHLVVDEVQDFSVAELAALKHAVRAPHELTFVGDLAQKIISDKSFSSWGEVLAALGFKDTAPLSLTVAHRSTLQIMELAAALRARASDEGPQLAAPRMGAVPTYTTYPTHRDMTLAVVDWVRGRTRESPRALCGIICRTVDEAAQLVTDLRNTGLPNVRLGHREFDFSPGVIAAAVAEVKGLEFRHVLVVNPSVRAYAPDRPESRNLLYVAATRAEASLDFAGVDEPSPLLPAWLFEEDPEEHAEEVPKENPEDDLEAESGEETV
jgi:DNA helicase IV